MKNRYYIFIYIKDLYSTAECLKRGFDPETKNLAVAKYGRSNTTLCLDISPAMKRLGIKANPRLFDIPEGIKYVIAEPDMLLYYKYSAAVYEIVLRYISKDAVCVFNTSEIFIDATDYITKHNDTTREFSAKIRDVIYDELKFKTNIGIGTNLYLAKAAAMLLADNKKDKTAFLDEKIYREKIINTVPLKDFWFITDEEAVLLKEAGLNTMADVLKNGCETSAMPKRRFKMIYECANADTAVNLKSLKTGKLRLMDKSIFPANRAKSFCEELKGAEGISAPAVEFSMDAYNDVREKLKTVNQGMLITLVYYSCGEYIKLCGEVSEIEVKKQSLTVVDKTLSFSDIMKIY